MSSVGERIKELRKSQKLSQAEFGKRIGLARNTIANYEIGTRTPMDQTLISIGREYNVSYIWLRDGVGEVFIDLPETALDELTLEYDLNDFERGLVEKFIKLSKQEREAITKYMKSVFDFK